VFFRKRNGSVYHVLSDERTGEAPCGERLNASEFLQLREGRLTPLMSAEKPTDAPLCKHCEKRKEV
jgi:hypothetical protein